MSAKKKVTKEEILNAAIDMVRGEGIESLNMRSLAEKCKCSTQPIYHCFSCANELKREVLKLATQKFNEAIEREIAKSEFPEYKAVGMGYIRFAKNEKQLFRFLFMREREEEISFEAESFEKSTGILMRNDGMPLDAATRFHAEMWVFVHGIATMYVTGYQNWDEQTVSDMLTDVFKGLKHNLYGDNNDN